MRERFPEIELAAVLLLAEDQRRRLVVFVRIEPGGGRQRFEQRVVKFAEALAVLGGKGDRIAEAEAEGLVGAVAPRHALGLVGDDDDGLSDAPHGRGEMAVGRRDPGACVDDEEDRVAIEKGGLGLSAHAAHERLGIAFLEPRRVDDGEGEVHEPRLALAPVARDAGLIVDESELAPNQPIEQGRLADIRAADDRDLAHNAMAFRCAGRRRRFVGRSAGQLLGWRPV